MKKTKHGFNIYAEFKDTYGGTVKVQESSSVNKRVWIFYTHPNNGKKDGIGETIAMEPHLSAGQAKRLIKALERFINDNPND